MGWIHGVEAFAVILIPSAFVVSAAYGILKSAASSNPHFLGSKGYSRFFFVVLALFVANLAHNFLDIRYLFGRPLLEYAVIIGGMCVLYGLSSLHDRAEVAKMEAELSKDPRSRRCPKCRSFVERLVVECPKCQTLIP